jgi:hypothetical protein
MFTTSRIKWIGTIILAGLLLIVALLGGKWGSSYSASAHVYTTPNIYSIIPVFVPEESPDTPMTISGNNFGSMDVTRVWISKGCFAPTPGCFPEELDPSAVSPTQVSVTIPASYLVSPAIYWLQVVVYVGETVPFGNYSNPALFIVGHPDHYLPLIQKISP